MYEIFNPFLRTATWHEGERADFSRFNQTLASIVGDDRFDPDEMGRYMRDKTLGAFDGAVDMYVAAAWSVKVFLDDTGTAPGVKQTLQ